MDFAPYQFADVPRDALTQLALQFRTDDFQYKLPQHLFIDDGIVSKKRGKLCIVRRIIAGAQIITMIGIRIIVVGATDRRKRSRRITVIDRHIRYLDRILDGLIRRETCGRPGRLQIGFASDMAFPLRLRPV